MFQGVTGYGDVYSPWGGKKKMKLLILLTLKKLHSMKAFLFFFCVKHREVSDILKSFLNMLISHKINEAKNGGKTCPAVPWVCLLLGYSY